MCVEIAEAKLIRFAKGDRCRGVSDLPRDELEAAPGRFLF
jgi:hypothetical protein